MAGAGILVESLPGDVRIARLEDGVLTAFRVETGGGTLGDIRLGRVGKIHAGLQAAFVDVGLARDGFLGLAEARGAASPRPDERIGDHVAEGDAVLVQVLREPLEDKGAKLTRDLTLPGRLLVFTPCQPGLRLSRRLAGDDARRLREAITPLLAEGEGVVVRSAAAAADDAALAAELLRLRAAWSETERAAAAARAPALVRAAPDALEMLLLEEPNGIAEIVVDDPAALQRLRALAATHVPALAERIRPHRGLRPLFEEEGVAAQLEACLERRVPLPGGGSLIIDETAALVAIDVNSGSRSEGDETAHRVNLAAAAEIARQIRLRELSGLIVVDALGGRNQRRRAEFLDALRAAVAADRVPVRVFGFTPAGLVEMTRQRLRPSLAQSLLGACPACRGGGLVRAPRAAAMDALRAVLAERRARPGRAVRLRAAPAVAAALAAEAGSARLAVEERLGGPLAVVAEEGLAPTGHVVEEAD